MRALFVSLFAAPVLSDFCCYWPSYPAECGSCDEQHFNIEEGDCQAEDGNTWCGSTPTPSPAPSPSLDCGDWNVATWTFYTSYPSCCPDNPNYDPAADTSECDDYSGCQYSGDFAYTSHKSFDWVQSNNIIAFYSTHGDNGDYGGDTLRVSAHGQSFEVQVVDTCDDADCSGCCSRNANKNGGYLVDMEDWTVRNNFGGNGEDVFGGESRICWQVVGAEESSTPAPAGGAGNFNNADTGVISGSMLFRHVAHAPLVIAMMATMMSL